MRSGGDGAEKGEVLRALVTATRKRKERHADAGTTYSLIKLKNTIGLINFDKNTIKILYQKSYKLKVLPVVKLTSTSIIDFFIVFLLFGS